MVRWAASPSFSPPPHRPSGADGEAGCGGAWGLGRVFAHAAARFAAGLRLKRIDRGAAGGGKADADPGRRGLHPASPSPTGSYESSDEGARPSEAECAEKSLGLPAWPRHRFEFHRVLGRGSFGTVILATDTMDQQTTATSSRENSTFAGFSSFRNSFPRRRSTSLVRTPSASSAEEGLDDEAEQRASRRSLSLSSLSSRSSGSPSHSGAPGPTRQEQQYAVKRISKSRLSRRALHDIRKEIDVHRSLGKSINVIYIYGAYEDEHYVYIVLELCTGGVLYQRIKLGNYR